MARIAGVDLPREKRIEIGLTYIFGIGLTTSKKILAATGINPDTRVRTSTKPQYPSSGSISTIITEWKANFARKYRSISKDLWK